MCAIALAVEAPGITGAGIDLEVDRLPRGESARFYLTGREQEWAAQRHQCGWELLRLWTAKEALFKSDPGNADANLWDYELRDPSALAGTGLRKGQPVIRLRYASLRLDTGFLTAAVSGRERPGA
jgi:hypothetical protein